MQAESTRPQNHGQALQPQTTRPAVLPSVHPSDSRQTARRERSERRRPAADARLVVQHPDSASHGSFRLTPAPTFPALQVEDTDSRREACNANASAPAAVEDLRSSWVQFLGRWPWDLFGTFTFREDAHPESAFKLFRLFVSIINRKLYGVRYYKRGQGVLWCCAMERQRRGVVHFHALFKSAELVELLRSSWKLQESGRWGNELMELWNDLAGFARIEPIDSSELVRNYVSKYCLKGGEIDLGGPGMQGQRLPGHPSRVDRSWLTTEAGRASALALVKRAASPDELGQLLSWARGEVGSRRAGAALLRSMRARVGTQQHAADHEEQLRPDPRLRGM